MKKTLNLLSVAIIAMVAFVSCAKQEIDAPDVDNVAEEEVVVNAKTVEFIAESIETKTAFGTPIDKVYPTLWTVNDESVKLLVNLNEEFVANVSNVSEDSKTAKLNADILIKENGSVAPYVFYAISPLSAYLGKTSERFAVTIPTTQTPLVNSVDESAQILYAISDGYNEIPESVALNFKHLTAYGKLSFVNLNLGDAKVLSVAITSSVNFANRWNYHVADGTYSVNSGSSTITLNTSGVENLWFSCAPVDMNNQTLTFTINTDKGPLSKTVTLTNKKFEAGVIATMKVDMSGVEFSQSQVYELLTDVSNLTVESKIIIAAANANQAISTTQNGNNRAQASITKSSDKSTISDPGNDVLVITVADGNKDDTFSFKTGDKYLYAPANGNYLRETETLNDNASWSVTINSDGIATIKANVSSKNWLRYNSSNNPPIFSCYDSGQADVVIYKLRGSGTAPLPKLTAPIISAELNEDETGINVSWNAVESATSYVVTCTGADNIETVNTACSFTNLLSGDYTITVTAKAEGYRSAKSIEVSVNVPFVGGTDVGAAYTAEFFGKNITLGTALTIGDVNWIITSEGSTAINLGTSDQGKQFGTKNSPCTKLVFKGAGYVGGVQNVRVNTSCASNTGPKISSVKVGGVEMNSPASTALLKGTNSEFVFTSDTPLNGDIVVTWTSSSKAGIYVKSISINK